MGWVHWLIVVAAVVFLIFGFALHFWELRKESPPEERRDNWMTAAFLLSLIILGLLFKAMR